jgi:polar amino acid transport system substrate-binding protein
MFNFKARDFFLAGFILGAIIVAVIILSILIFQSRSAVAEEPKSDLPDLNGREVSIAVENAYLPFNYIDPQTGEPAGWDYDAWNTICELLNCIPVFVETSWEEIIQGIEQGRFDVVANGTVYTDARAEVVDFSVPYMRIEQRMLVRREENRFRTVAAAQADNSLVVGAETGTHYYDMAIWTFGEERVEPLETSSLVLQALIGGDVDLAIADEWANIGYQGDNADQLKFIGEAIASDWLGFVFPKGSDMVEPVNAALAEMEADGLLESLAEKYFSDAFTITNDELQQ